MAKMVHVREDVLKSAINLLSLYHALETQKASLTKAQQKPAQENKHRKKAQEIRAVVDDIRAALDAKE